MTGAVFALIALLVPGSVAAQVVREGVADFGRIDLPWNNNPADDPDLEDGHWLADIYSEPVDQYHSNSPITVAGRPVGRLDVLGDDLRSRHCTAFIVDHEHVLTSNRCVSGAAGQEGWNVVAAMFIAGHNTRFDTDHAERFRVSPEVVESGPQIGYSLLRVFGNPSAKFGTVALGTDAPEDDEPLFIIGHPMAGSQHVARERCRAASPSHAVDGTIAHSCDTLRGYEGAPVFQIINSTFRVIAMHDTGSRFEGQGIAIPMSRILDASRILPAAHEGIQP